jgi:hypothetical protein
MEATTNTIVNRFVVSNVNLLYSCRLSIEIIELEFETVPVRMTYNNDIA